MLGLASRVRAGDGGVRYLGPDDTEIAEGTPYPGIKTSIGQQHDEKVLLGIDPDLGTGPAGVPIRR